MTATKTCEVCGQSKPATSDYFGPNLRYKDRLKLYCLTCGPIVAAERRKRKNERSRAWAEANRDKARESVQRSYWKSRRERLAYLRRYRQENRERIREYNRQYRERQRTSLG